MTQGERKWQPREGQGNQERYYDAYRYTPYTTDLEFFSDPHIYETNDLVRTTQYKDANPGPYSGRGPRGYRRSDERIHEEVNDLLTWEGRIDASDIQVDVHEGVVTLTGSVNSRDEKRMAERIIENVFGVLDVNNQLTINRQTGGERSPAVREMGNRIRVGMRVLDSEGQEVGRVKEVRSSDILVDRPLARDVYVPFSACDLLEDEVRLHVRSLEVDEQNWPVSDLFGTTEPESRKEM